MILESRYSGNDGSQAAGFGLSPLEGCLHPLGLVLKILDIEAVCIRLMNINRQIIGDSGFLKRK